MDHYFINKDTSMNPHGNNEIHCARCEILLKISKYKLEDLGLCYNGLDALSRAKTLGYTNADGCAVCCPEAHRE